MPRHLSTFSFGLNVIAMLLDGQVFNALAQEEPRDGGQESSADILATDAGDWQGQSVEVVGARVVDVQGQVHRLGVGTDATPFVIVFIGEQCPISTRYAPELNRFGTLARDSGLTMYGVISDPFMSATEARAFVAEYALDFNCAVGSFGRSRAQAQANYHAGGLCHLAQGFGALSRTDRQSFRVPRCTSQPDYLA